MLQRKMEKERLAEPTMHRYAGMGANSAPAWMSPRVFHVVGFYSFTIRDLIRAGSVRVNYNK